MSINVKYFASLRETVGRSEDQLDLDANMTVADVWDKLHPGNPLPESVLTAVNREYQDLGTIVRDGDEVAFFPPVTGG